MADLPRLKQERVGQKWMITSPDVPGLYVVDADLDKALAAVPSALEMLARMTDRQGKRERLRGRLAACT